MVQTPQDLIDSGLYHAIACALYAPPHRAIGFALGAMAHLGAKDDPKAQKAEIRLQRKGTIKRQATGALGVVVMPDGQNKKVDMKTGRALEEVEPSISVDMDDLDDMNKQEAPAKPQNPTQSPES